MGVVDEIDDPGLDDPCSTVFGLRDHQLAWEGALDRDQQVQIDLSVQVDDPLPDGTSISLPAALGYDEHALSFELPLILRVNAPDLGASTLNVEPAMAPPSSTLTYTLHIRNTGVRGAIAIVTASAPDRTTSIMASMYGRSAISRSINRSDSPGAISTLRK